MRMDASFEKPTQKNWKKKYIQLDFSYSIKELESIAKSLRKQSKGSKHINTQTHWLGMAFLEKCKCDACRPAWQAFDKVRKKAEAKAHKENLARIKAYKKAAKRANKKRVTKQ